MDINLINQNITSAKASQLTESKIETKDDKELKEACQGFEAIFLNTMMKSMRDTLPGDGLFGKSQGMDIYQSMLDQGLTENISKGENSSGIGEYLYRELQGQGSQKK